MLQVELRRHLNKKAGVERDTSLDYVNEIVNNDSSIEKEILSRFGSTGRLAKQTINLKEHFRKDCWTGQELQDACVRFGLRMVPLSMYNKPIPVSALAEIRMFIGQDTKLLDRMFIVCPKSHLNIDTALSVSDPLIVFDKARSIGKRYVLQQSGYGTREVNLLSNKHGMFPYVTSWGGTFSWFRRAKAFFTNVPVATAIILTAIAFIGLSLYLSSSLAWYWQIPIAIGSAFIGLFAGATPCAVLDRYRNYSLMCSHEERWLTNCK